MIPTNASRKILRPTGEPQLYQDPQERQCLCVRSYQSMAICSSFGVVSFAIELLLFNIGFRVKRPAHPWLNIGANQKRCYSGELPATPQAGFIANKNYNSLRFIDFAKSYPWFCPWLTRRLTYLGNGFLASMAP